MNSMTVTIADHTATGQSLYTLLSKGSQTGYTCAPATGIAPSLTLPANVSFLTVQASKGNSTNIVYVGDENCANDGSRQARELGAGDVYQIAAEPNLANLRQIYVRGGADSVKFNIEIDSY
jgi:hypothetical protein